LHGLFVLFGALWFGAGAAIFVLVLVGIFTGKGQWTVGLPEQVLVTALVVFAIVGPAACAIATARAAYLELLVAVRGWVPNLLRIVVREAEPAILCSRGPVAWMPEFFAGGMLRGSRLVEA
jgi:hypothetical protein